MLFYLLTSNALYFSGLIHCIYLNNKNLLTFLIASEFMFLGVDLLFIGASLIFNKNEAILFAVIILMLTVGESIIGLSLCVFSLKLKHSIYFFEFSSLKY
jgi:NADH:ubiquinone oxidoreductase subunit K